jgi:hypothetical protein
MLRGFFLAVGVYAVILGMECLVLDKAVLHGRESGGTLVARELAPPDWAPWSLLSGGAVVMLYSFTIPAKMRS